MFKKILIANRGEIAVRVLRAAKELGIPYVTVHSEADKDALHVLMSEESYNIGPAPSIQSYLDIDRIIEVAKKSGADAIHPGYGFLSENAEFARRCEEEGITFIGPPHEAIDAMGDKLTARKIAMEAGVPVVPGSEDPVASLDEARSIAREIGYPIMLKASAGGGGKGMRLVFDESELENAFTSARREAKSAFGDDRVYIEKYLEEPHHIEIQIMADKHGNYFHLNERECSVQRRHQKVIEESPSPYIDDTLRHKIADSALKLARKVGYFNAGTVEFLVDKYKNYYFLEMNTRLQVEHPVTEMVTGIDLVKAQFRVAAGEKLTWSQSEIKQRGHAIEARIYAEDPLNNFNPSPGKIVGLVNPSNPGIRLDSGVYEGFTIPIYYDPMIAKLIAWGETREDAINRMLVALDEYVLAGVKNNIVFHQIVIDSDRFRAGRYDTTFLNEFDYRERIRERKRKLLEEAILSAAAVFYTENTTFVEKKEGNGPSVSPWKLYGRVQNGFFKVKPFKL